MSVKEDRNGLDLPQSLKPAKLTKPLLVNLLTTQLNGGQISEVGKLQALAHMGLARSARLRD